MSGFYNRNLRIFVAVPRSASTLFMRVMAGYSTVAVTSRNILMGNMMPRPMGSGVRQFQPDYSIFNDMCHPVILQAKSRNKGIVISKEEFGNDRNTGTPKLNECNFDIFPDDNSVIVTRPVFTFRDPHSVFDSWLSKGWSDLPSFLLCYSKHCETFKRCQAVYPGTLGYTYDYLIENRMNQCKIFSEICESWDIRFDASTLEFRTEFGSDFIYRNEKEAHLYRSENPKGIFTTLIGSTTIERNVPKHNLLSPVHTSVIADVLSPLYDNIKKFCIDVSC